MARRLGSEPGVVLIVVSAQSSGRGKTRWVEALTRELGARGRRCGVVKHHPHGPGDAAGGNKDTDRALRAGAVGRVLAEPGLLRLYVDADGAESLLTAAVRALCATAAVDVVLAEGFRSVPTRLRLWVGEGQPEQGDGLCLRVTGEDSADGKAVAAVVDRLLAAAGA